MSFLSQGVPFTALPSALRGKLQPNQLAVLWVIQTFTGSNANCWPSLKTIADGACVSVRTARAVLGQLESMGLLQRERRFTDQGHSSTNLYRVTVNHLANTPEPSFDGAAEFAGDPGTICRTPRQELPPPPAGAAAELNTRELDTEELNNSRKAAKGPKRDKPAYSEEFLAFWQRYQKIKKRASGQSKPKAWAEYKKLARGPQKALEGALMAALKDQAIAERNGGFASPFPDCFRWLRDGRYESFLETATTAKAQPAPLLHSDAQEGDPF
jgi:arginyl-tRNA--protein-N-Asp/Glu arginylyltransferase